MISAEQTPGFPSALAVIQRAGGVLLTAEAAHRLTVLALAAAGPHIRAEVLADIADDLAGTAETFPTGHISGVLLQLAGAFDRASHDIREALNS